MSSQVFRIAAAVLAVLAITGVAMLFHGGAAFAFDDFAAPILEAKTTKCKMTVVTKGPPVRTITSDVMTLDGGRMRQEIEMADKSKLVMITDLNQAKKLTLTPASKTATVLTLTNRPKNTSLDLDNFRRLLLDARDNPRVKRQPLGEKEIDGHRVVGFHFSSQGGDFSLWGDPETGLPVRFEVTMGVDDSVKLTFSDFVFNADMDESLFSVEPPAGYTVRNQKTDGSPTEEKSLIEMFREYSELFGGAFPDSLDSQTTQVIFWKKANIEMNIQYLWEGIAPGIGKPNEEQRHKLEELALGKLNEEQIKEFFGEKIKESVETLGQKTAEAMQAQAQKNYESRQAELMEIQGRVSRGLNFANGLPSNADAHYVGKGVSFGAADTPIFWYRPEDSTKYRVIYADLSVRDSDTPPNVTKGQPVPAPSSPKE
jgi:outer membrane lipoprotein-sorting protein